MSGAVGVRGVDRYQKSEVAKYVITMRDSLFSSYRSRIQRTYDCCTDTRDHIHSVFFLIFLIFLKFFIEPRPSSSLPQKYIEEKKKEGGAEGRGDGVKQEKKRGEKKIRIYKFNLNKILTFIYFATLILLIFKFFFLFFFFLLFRAN